MSRMIEFLFKKKDKNMDSTEITKKNIKEIKYGEIMSKYIFVSVHYEDDIISSRTYYYVSGAGAF